jgi:single-strand DNA-binding protein
MYQRFEVIGRVTNLPEMRYTPSGEKPVTSFTVAVNEKFGDKESTLWVRVSTWNGLAEVCNKYVTKGMMVFVEGRIRPDTDGNPRAFVRKDGTPGASLDVTANVVKFLGDKKTEGADSFDDDGDDIPF